MVHSGKSRARESGDHLCGSLVAAGMANGPCSMPGQSARCLGAIPQGPNNLAASGGRADYDRHISRVANFAFLHFLAKNPPCIF